MKNLSLLLPILILLSGCASSQPDTMLDGNIQAQATLEAMRSASQEISSHLTVSAYVPTQQSVQTATERAWLLTGWTATAAIEQTVTAASGTATQQAWNMVATQRAADITATVEIAAASARATALYGESVEVELAIERGQIMNKVQAAAPWSILLGLLVCGLVMAFRWFKVRPIQRDERGDAPLLVINGSVYDADRNPYSLLDFSGKKPVIPMLTSVEIQSATTTRDQMVDLATRGSFEQSGYQRRELARQMTENATLPAPANIQMISPEQARPLLGNVINGIIRDSIDADLSDEQQGAQHD